MAASWRGKGLPVPRVGTLPPRHRAVLPCLGCAGLGGARLRLRQEGEQDVARNGNCRGNLEEGKQGNARRGSGINTAAGADVSPEGWHRPRLACAASGTGAGAHGGSPHAPAAQICPWMRACPAALRPVPGWRHGTARGAAAAWLSWERRPGDDAVPVLRWGAGLPQVRGCGSLSRGLWSVGWGSEQSVTRPSAPSALGVRGDHGDPQPQHVPLP